MVLKVKPKTFGPIFVSYTEGGDVRYAEGDTTVTSPHPPAGSPVDTMIASLGSCIVKSVEWAAGQRQVSLNPFMVKVVGTKSTELPGRIASIELTIIGDIVDDIALIPRILKQAKAICTVSNSLNSDVTLKVDNPDSAQSDGTSL